MDREKGGGGRVTHFPKGGATIEIALLCPEEGAICQMITNGGWRQVRAVEIAPAFA